MPFQINLAIRAKWKYFLLQFLCATDDCHSFFFYVLHGTIVTLTISSMFMYRIRDILILSKKIPWWLKMKTCGQWIMRLTLILMYALCSMLNKKEYVISKFFIPFFGVWTVRWIDESKKDTTVKLFVIFIFSATNYACIISTIAL